MVLDGACCTWILPQDRTPSCVLRSVLEKAACGGKLVHLLLQKYQFNTPFLPVVPFGHVRDLTPPSAPFPNPYTAYSIHTSTLPQRQNTIRSRTTDSKA